MEHATRGDYFSRLLLEATSGSLLGMRAGESVADLRARLGEPHPHDMGPQLLRYDSVEFLLNDDGTTIGCIYVEVPGDIVLEADTLPNVPTLVPTVDPAQCVATVGPARIFVDSKTRRILSFAV